MLPEERAAQLKRWAVEAGFDRAGAASLEPSRHRRAFLAWLERGDHAGMEFMTRRRRLRLEAEKLLDGGRSVLCVALQYHPPAAGPTVEGDLWPRVARYARGEDYHEIMWERLDRLAERIEKAFPGTRTRSYVDTGPVLERELAARAGIGVPGKNTNLLHPEAGSWFLLGELFLTLALAPDQPLADLCGSCSRCLEACPTGALTEPFRLDSRRCISYWTIEHRGAIPVQVRGDLDDWVFGCDLCQETCPLNDAPQIVADRRFELPPARRALDLAALLALERKEYLEVFRRSPMKRARLEGLRRNAAVAMGNRGRPEYVAPLAAALAGDDPVVRAHAAWALGRIGGKEATESLAAALAGEPDAEVRDEIRRALTAAASGPRTETRGSKWS